MVLPCSIDTTSGRGTITSRTGRSPNSKTLCNISASSSSTVPSLCPIDIMVRISPSLTRERDIGSPPASLLNLEVTALSASTAGVNALDASSIGRASFNDSRSALWAAIILGVASHSTSSRTATPIVAIRIPHSFHIETARAVPKTAAAVLTRLLPVRIVDNSFSGCFIILATRSAPGTLAFTICSTLTLSSEANAVSELEKKAERARKTMKSAR